MNQKELETFVQLPFHVFEGHPYWVPQLLREEREVFDEKKNPAYAGATSRQYVAYKEGRPVGRIAAILSRVANEKHNTKNLRFGWFDAFNDPEVSKALFDAVEDWGRELGMETLTGPHGFTDLDPEGMLVEGFNELPTIAVYYNFPYYNDLVEAYGFEKDIDYVEYQLNNIQMPHEQGGGIPPRIEKLGEQIKKRSGVKLLEFKNKAALKARAPEIFDLLDEAYEDLYGAVPLTRTQIEYYVDKFFDFVDKDLIPVAVNEKNEIVGFMIAMPSLSKGFQQAKGHLLPLGWAYIFKSLKSHEVLDFYLAGIKKEYRGRGVDLLMVLDIYKTGQSKGYHFAESNPELETNKQIQALWKHFNPRQHKRRRIYRKPILAT